MGAGQSAPGGFFKAPTQANLNAPRNSFTKRAGNGVKAIRNGVAKGYKTLRNRERAAPGNFFGNQRAPFIVGNNRGKTRTWRNFFSTGKNYINRKTKGVQETFRPIYSGPAYAPKLFGWRNFFGFTRKATPLPKSVERAASASAKALQTGNPADANKAITLLDSAQKTVETNPGAADIVTSALKNKSLRSVMRNMQASVAALNKSSRARGN